MAGEPQVRALTSQVALQYVERLPAGPRAAILAELPEAGFVTDAFQFAWIPFPLQIKILDAMRRHLPPSEWHASQRTLALAYLDKPVLRGLFDTAVRVLGLSVGTLAKWSPRAYDALFKDAGTLTFTAGRKPGELVLTLDDFPRDLFASGSFVEALEAALGTIFTLARSKGRITTDGVDRGRGHARYTLAVEQ
jgi:hypothetical protein